MATLQVQPGRGLGFLTLGGSLHEILARLKKDPETWPSLDLIHWPPAPLLAPVVLNLPENGIRLRFDGPDQRLRLIEVLDFTKISLTYDSRPLVKSGDSTGPTFRYVYDKLLGPAFPGDFVPPKDNKGGVYILSYPGVAFSFTLTKTSWQSEDNFVTILSAPSVPPASSMVVFAGQSWQEACQELFTRPCTNPRSLALTARTRDQLPDEVEIAHVLPSGTVDLLRRSSQPFKIVLGVTTPQDLATELGPPDAVYTKSDRRLSIHRTPNDAFAVARVMSTSDRTHFEEAVETDHSSSHAATDDSEDDVKAGAKKRTLEYFYNYYQHGLDILFSDCASLGQNADRLLKEHGKDGPLQLVATKVFLHGNVPGSHPFNRHRRLRWVLDQSFFEAGTKDLGSESSFGEISAAFQHHRRDSSSTKGVSQALKKGMPINREWDSPGSSCELLDKWDEQKKSDMQDGEQHGSSGNGKTELFGYPGLVFEVMRNGAISCLTIY